MYSSHNQCDLDHIKVTALSADVGWRLRPTIIVRHSPYFSESLLIRQCNSKRRLGLYMQNGFSTLWNILSRNRMSVICESESVVLYKFSLQWESDDRFNEDVSAARNVQLYCCLVRWIFGVFGSRWSHGGAGPTRGHLRPYIKFETARLTTFSTVRMINEHWSTLRSFQRTGH